MDGYTLSQLLELATLTDHQAHQLSGLSARQWRRYRASGAPVPAWLARLLITCSGQLGVISRAWHGWRIVNDCLYSPDGDRYPLQWFASLPGYLVQLQAERATLRERIRDLENTRRFKNTRHLRLVWDSNKEEIERCD